MNYGPFSFEAEPGSLLSIRASGTFIVYAVTTGQRTRILGPDSASTRYWKHQVPLCEEIEIETEPDTAIEWKMQALPAREETPDPVPVEIPVSGKKPESLESIVARLLHDHLEREQQAGRETFEEADDFDIADEETWTSPYEFVDMDEDAPFYPDVEKDQSEEKAVASEPVETDGRNEVPPNQQETA